MENKSYRLRGTPDCPVSVYANARLSNLSHQHPEVELFLLQSGTVHWRLEDQDIQQTAGDILIFNPNQHHSILSFSKDLRHMTVTFSLEIITMPKDHIFQRNFVMPLWIGRLRLPNLLQPGHPAYKKVRDLILQIRRGNPYTDEIKLFRYTQVVAICAALQPYCIQNPEDTPAQSPEDQTMRKVMIYIYFYYHHPLTLEQIAAHVHLHPNYLCKVFKSYTGQTVMDFLAKIRVEAAKFLLRRDALSMPRVAELTGFPSERAFYRNFKKFTGITPKAYQKQQFLPENRE